MLSNAISKIQGHTIILTCSWSQFVRL